MTPVIPVPPHGQIAPAASLAAVAGTAAAPGPRHASPGRDRLGIWLYAAAAGLLVLAAAAAAVSFSAQYRLVYAARHLAVAAGMEAAIPDAAALVFACLGIALALHGRRAVRARALNAASAGASMFMNVIAAAPGWRDLAVWAMPPAAYALASDTLIGVIRTSVLARHQGPGALAGEATILAVLGGVLLWLLRLTMAPASTLSGFRAWVLEECPVAPGRRAAIPVSRAASPAPAGASVPPRAAPKSTQVPSRRGPAPRGGTKTSRFLALVVQRHGPLAAVPLGSVSRISARVAPQVDLNPGSARAALRRAVLTAQNGEARIIKYAILLAVVIILAALFTWAFLPARYLPGNRVRSLQVRLHLRLHPGKGFATIVGLWLRWGRLAALRRSGRIRRSLPLWARALAPGEHSVFLGRAHWRHGLRVPLEEHVLVMAPPRTFKTAFLADVILRYPGPVIATTTKADVFGLTAAVRSQRGPVHVFNPQYIGAVPSTFSWSPVAGCEDPATAIRRADAFAFAVSREGVEDGSFWSAKASDYLRGYFHAAALGGYDMRAVAAWVSGADPHVPEQILTRYGARQWALTLAELRSEAQKTTATVRMVMSRALSFMADPALAASVLPAPSQGFDIPSFLRDCGTVYMVAEAIGEDAPVGPLFAAMATEIHYVAALMGQASESGRLDPPLLMGLDEVTQICPVPLPQWLSDSGGKGIQVVAVVHGEAQLAGRWEDHGRQIVWDTSSVKVFLPGITDTTTLQAASTLCGQAQWKVRGQDHPSQFDIATADMIRQLPAGFALVIRGGYAPVIARLPRAWNNSAYRRARRRGLASAFPGHGFPLSAEPATEPDFAPRLGTGLEPEAEFPDYPPPGWATGDDRSFPWN